MKVHKVRVEQADERNAERANRSHAKQLRELDARLGNGGGAVKERRRLVKKINKEVTTQ